jgi:hypothetical protein
VALVIHGIESLTMDIDLSVNMTDGNLAKFIKATTTWDWLPARRYRLKQSSIR